MDEIPVVRPFPLVFKWLSIPVTVPLSWLISNKKITCKSHPILCLYQPISPKGWSRQFLLQLPSVSTSILTVFFYNFNKTKCYSEN